MENRTPLLRVTVSPVATPACVYYGYSCSSTSPWLMTTQVRIEVHWFISFFWIYQAINYHPMNLLPLFASSSNYNIADLLSKSLPCHRFNTLIGDIHHPPTVNPTATVASSATVVATTVVASTVDPLTPPATAISVSVPTLIHPNPVPYFVDTGLTGASLPVAPSYSDLLSVTQAPFGLIRSTASVAYSSKVTSKVTSTPVDPYALITGDDTTTTDLSSPDLIDLDSNSVDTFEFASTLTKDHFDIWEFGTATLVFISNSELTTILVEPTLDWTDWFDWIPLPWLTPTESYYHIFGLNYSQAFALFHLIPIWIALVFVLLRSE